MPPKNKGKAKDKSTDDSSSAASKSSSGKLKPATSINVRHILCEKHSVKEEALRRLAAGEKFDDVARSLSEDKKRQGTSSSLLPVTFYVEVGVLLGGCVDYVCGQAAV
jgi:NIMA-interacting peptidyl-prolyl cis-trans isomerase 4